MSEVTPETANPLHLVRGALFQVEAAYPSIATAVFLASDEGQPGTTPSSTDLLTHETGDASTYPFFDRTFRDMHHARALADTAVGRAELLGPQSVLDQARVVRGWILVRLAELWGAQPLGDGVVHPPAELFDTALGDFAAVVAGVPDPAGDTSVARRRREALAGIARIQWQRGRDPVDRMRLEAAIAAAQLVLAANPTFVFEPIPPRSTYLSGFGLSRVPEAGFQFVPNPIPLPATRAQLVRFIDANELRLIQAEAHLLLGDLAAAKAAVKGTIILPINTVGVGRAPGPRTRPPLTAAEIAAAIDPLDAAGLRRVIEELRRESQFGYGRRGVRPDGQPVLPIPLPPDA